MALLLHSTTAPSLAQITSAQLLWANLREPGREVVLPLSLTGNVHVRGIAGTHKTTTTNYETSPPLFLRPSPVVVKSALVQSLPPFPSIPLVTVESTPFEHWRRQSRWNDDLFEEETDEPEEEVEDELTGDIESRSFSEMETESLEIKTKKRPLPPLSSSPTKSTPAHSTTISTNQNQNHKRKATTTLIPLTTSTSSPTSSVPVKDRNIVKLKSPPKKIQRVERIVLGTQEVEVEVETPLSSDQARSLPIPNVQEVFERDGSLKPVPLPAPKRGKLQRSSDAAKGEGAIQRCLPSPYRLPIPQHGLLNPAIQHHAEIRYSFLDPSPSSPSSNTSHSGSTFPNARKKLQPPARGAWIIPIYSHSPRSTKFLSTALGNSKMSTPSWKPRFYPLTKAKEAGKGKEKEKEKEIPPSATTIYWTDARLRVFWETIQSCSERGGMGNVGAACFFPSTTTTSSNLSLPPDSDRALDHSPTHAQSIAHYLSTTIHIRIYSNAHLALPLRSFFTLIRVDRNSGASRAGVASGGKEGGAQGAGKNGAGGVGAGAAGAGKEGGEREKKECFLKNCGLVWVDETGEVTLVA